MSHKRLAFVCPRLAGEGAVGGAETLLRRLAEHAAARGASVDFLTTCAQSHFTWENTLPPGQQKIGDLNVYFFPVDDRDAGVFLHLQEEINRGHELSEAEQAQWLKNGVHSSALLKHLGQNIEKYDQILTGPYLFGLTYFTAMAHPDKTVLIPCLHDEGFARVPAIAHMFHAVSGCMFNAHAERELARELYRHPDARSRVVGMGLDPFSVDPAAFARNHGISTPYVLYCGRREPLKGTPLIGDYMYAFRQRTGRDIRLVFTGSGTIDAPTELWPAIFDFGFVSEQEKHEAMAGAVAFIHPSVNESFGIVLLESFLAGTPALVHAQSRVLVDQCRHAQAGFWFRHYPDFETQLLYLLDHPAQRARLGETGRTYVADEYSWPVIEEKFFEALCAFETHRTSGKTQ